MLALFGNLDFMELVVVAAAALMIFGRRLPEVAVRAAAQVVRLRRTVTQMWREAGIDEEIRRVQRELDRKVQTPRIPSVDQLVRDADRRRAGQKPFELTPEGPRDPEQEGGVDPDAHRAHEGAPEVAPEECSRMPPAPAPDASASDASAPDGGAASPSGPAGAEGVGGPFGGATDPASVPGADRREPFAGDDDEPTA